MSYCRHQVTEGFCLDCLRADVGRGQLLAAQLTRELESNRAALDDAMREVDRLVREREDYREKRANEVENLRRDRDALAVRVERIEGALRELVDALGDRPGMDTTLRWALEDARAALREGEDLK